MCDYVDQGKHVLYTTLQKDAQIYIQKMEWELIEKREMHRKKS